MLIKSNLLLIGDNVHVHVTKFIFGLCLSSRTILSSVLLKNSMHTHWELMHLGIIIIIGMRGYSVPSIYDCVCIQVNCKSRNMLWCVCMQ